MKYKCISFTHSETLSCVLSYVYRCMRTGAGQCRPCDQRGSWRPSTAPTRKTTRQSRCPRAPTAPALRVLAAARALHAARAAPRHETGPRAERSPSCPPTAAHAVMDRQMLGSALAKRGTTAGLYRLKVNRPLAVLRSLLATCRSRSKPSSVLKEPRSHCPSGARLPSETGGFTNESHALFERSIPTESGKDQAFKGSHEIL